MLARLRLHHGAEFLSRVRLHVLLHGYDLAGDGRRARGERRQRDERYSRRRSLFHRSHSVRVLARASSSAIAVDNYDRQLLQLRQRIIFVTPKSARSISRVRNGHS